MKNIAVFMHITTISRWESILKEMVEIAMPVLNIAKRKTFCINDVSNNINIVTGKLIGLGNCEIINNNSNDWEYQTLKRLYDFACGEKEYWDILYLHTKGVNRIDKNEWVEQWRQYMMYFLCEQYKDCIGALKISDTCGVDLRKNPYLHYSGNFWWSTSNYIKTLCNPIDYVSGFGSYRHENEFWVCSNNNGKHHCLHESGIGVHERHLKSYLRKEYVK